MDQGHPSACQEILIKGVKSQPLMASVSGIAIVEKNQIALRHSEATLP